MWKVTHEQSADTMVDRCEKQTDRIEQLEMALRRLHSLPAHDYCDTLAGFAGAVRTIAYDALETAGDSAPLDSLKPAHECEKIASAIMAEGRDWWVGKLTKPVPGHEIETHCLHLTTPLKDVVFLVNDADFQWLTVLGRAACGPLSERWLESVTRGAIKRAMPDGDSSP